MKAVEIQAAWLRKHINWKKLRRHAYTFTPDPTTGDEFVQELYHDMLQWSPEELHDLRNPQAYATRAVTHRLTNWITRVAKLNTTEALPDDYDIVDESPSVEDVLDTRQRLIQFLAELPQQWVDPLLLTKYFGYSLEESAAMLGLSVDTVKKRALRAFNYFQATPPDSL